MLSKKLRKTLSITLAVCFMSTLYALPALAMPQDEDPNQVTHQRAKQGESKKPQHPSSSSSHRTPPSGPSAQHKPVGQQPQQPINRTVRQRPSDVQKTPVYPSPQPNRRPQHPVSGPGEHNGRKDIKSPVNIYRPEPRHPDNRPEPRHPDNRPDPRRPDNRLDDRHRPFGPGPNYEHHRPYPHWRRSNIVFRFGGPRDHFWWGADHGISLGEYLILIMIIQARPTLTIDEVFSMHKNGYSYETICYDYGLDWPSINHGARLRYHNMNTYSSEHGITFWSWSDTLGY